MVRCFNFPGRGLLIFGFLVEVCALMSALLVGYANGYVMVYHSSTALLFELILTKL